MPACAGKACGDDGCGGSCGTCADGESCTAAGQCEPACVGSCTGRECGDDGCGNDCGQCAEFETCLDGACKSLTCGPCETPADCASADDLCIRWPDTVVPAVDDVADATWCAHPCAADADCPAEPAATCDLGLGACLPNRSQACSPKDVVEVDTCGRTVRTEQQCPGSWQCNPETLNCACGCGTEQVCDFNGLCWGSSCANPWEPEGGFCSAGAGWTILLPRTTTATSENRLYDYQCSADGQPWAFNGPDIVYRLQTLEPLGVRFQLQAIQEGFAPRLAVLKGACEPTACMRNGDPDMRMSIEDNWIWVRATPGQPYYVVVDGRLPAQQGAYELRVRCAVPNETDAGPEACLGSNVAGEAGAVDEDLDGDINCCDADCADKPECEGNPCATAVPAG